MISSSINRNFFAKLARLALPVTLQTLLFSSRNMIDVLMIGQISESALAAVGLVSAAYGVAFQVLFGLNSAVGILGAQHWGAKNSDGVQKTVALGMVVGLTFSSALLLFFWGLPEFLVSVVTDRQELIPLGAEYIVFTAGTFPVVSVAISFQSGRNSIGRPKINLVFTSIGVVSNIFLNWVLIFGNLGAPALGLKGAAIGTMCSSLLELTAVLIYYYGSRHFLAVRWRILKCAVNKKDLRKFLALSIPLTVGSVAWSLGMFIYHVVYGHMGTVELAVMTMMEPIGFICFAFFWGISSATGVMIGHHLGANEFDHAWARCWVLTFIGFFSSVLAAIAVWLAKEPIFNVYGAVTPQTMALAVDVLAVVLLTIWLRAVNVIVIVGVLQSGGDNRFVLKMDMFCQWVVGIPLTYLAAFYWELPLTWVFLASMSEEMVKLFICTHRMYGRAWMRNLVREN